MYGTARLSQLLHAPSYTAAHNIDTEKPSWAFLDTSAGVNSQSAQLPPVLLAVLANYEHIEGHLIQLN